MNERPAGFVESSRVPSRPRENPHLMSDVAPCEPTSGVSAAGSSGVSAAATLLADFGPDDPARQLPTFPVEAPTSRIVAALESVDPASLSPIDLVEWVAGWHQVMAATTAHQARGVHVAATRPGPMGDFVTDEVACALVVTRQSVEQLVGRAAGLDASPELAEALMLGLVDARKVDVILLGTLTLPESSRRCVIAQATDVARGLTAPQLRRHVRRLVLVADPASAEQREKEARKERGVDLRWGHDSMAWVSAYLPAAAAMSAMTVIEALAAAAGAHDDRTVDQRRADAFADVFASILDADQAPDGTPLARRHGQRASVNVTVAASTLLDLDDLPGDLAGYGPIPAHVAREIAQDATWSRILTEPASGAFVERSRGTYRPGADLTRTVITRDVTCTYPGCRQSAARSELDHIEPFNHADPRAGGATSEDNLHAVCKHHHQAKTAKLWNSRRDKATGNTIWTSPLGITYVRSPVPVYAGEAVYGPHRPQRAPQERPPF